VRVTVHCESDWIILCWFGIFGEVLQPFDEELLIYKSTILYHSNCTFRSILEDLRLCSLSRKKCGRWYKETKRVQAANHCDRAVVIFYKEKNMDC
jgi:hypothetical protein